MRRATRFLSFTALAPALGACGGSVSTGPFGPGGPMADAAPIVIDLGFDASDAVDSGAVPAEAAASASLQVLPCRERAVPADCSKGDAPYYTAASLGGSWMDCGGTSGTADACGVLTVAFDESGCVTLDFSGVPAVSGAVSCLKDKLEAYRFECSAGSGIVLNHLCN